MMEIDDTNADNRLIILSIALVILLDDFPEEESLAFEGFVEFGHMGLLVIR